MSLLPAACAPCNSHEANNILRADALTVGERVTVLLGSADDVGTDSNVAYIVTDQRDKKGNVLLVNANTGATAYTTASTVFARY